MSFWPRALIPSPNRIEEGAPEAETQAVRAAAGVRMDQVGVPWPGEWEHPSWAVCKPNPLILVFLARPTRSVLTTLGAS